MILADENIDHQLILWLRNQANITKSHKGKGAGVVREVYHPYYQKGPDPLITIRNYPR